MRSFTVLHARRLIPILSLLADFFGSISHYLSYFLLRSLVPGYIYIETIFEQNFSRKIKGEMNRWQNNNDTKMMIMMITKQKSNNYYKSEKRKPPPTYSHQSFPMQKVTKRVDFTHLNEREFQVILPSRIFCHDSYVQAEL